MEKVLALVSCTAKKRFTRGPAEEMYSSVWFALARRYVKEMQCPWYILSANYGLLEPGEVINTYNRALNEATADDRQVWARNVGKKLLNAQPDVLNVMIFAGRHYREYLIPYLTEHGVRVEVPLLKMRIGEQLSWLKKHTK